MIGANLWQARVEAARNFFYASLAFWLVFLVIEDVIGHSYVVRSSLPIYLDLALWCCLAFSLQDIVRERPPVVVVFWLVYFLVVLELPVQFQWWPDVFIIRW